MRLNVPVRRFCCPAQDRENVARHDFLEQKIEKFFQFLRIKATPAGNDINPE